MGNILFSAKAAWYFQKGPLATVAWPGPSKIGPTKNLSHGTMNLNLGDMLEVKSISKTYLGTTMIWRGFGYSFVHVVFTSWGSVRGTMGLRCGLFFCRFFWRETEQGFPSGTSPVLPQAVRTAASAGAESG